MSPRPMRAGLMPALLTSTSMRPKRCGTPSTKPGIASHSPTWQASPSTSAPVRAAISSATSSHRSCLRLLTTTDAPAAARPCDHRPADALGRAGDDHHLAGEVEQLRGVSHGHPLVIAGSGSPVRAKHSLDVAAHEPLAQLGVEVVQPGRRRARRVRRCPRSAGSRTTTRSCLRQLDQHVERVGVAEAGEWCGAHVAPQHVAARTRRRASRRARPTASPGARASRRTAAPS